MTFEQMLLTGLMLIAGIGIPVMAAWNADLGATLSHPLAAAALLSVFAAVLSLMLLAVVGMPNLSDIRTARPLYYFAGALFVLYIVSITYSAPRIGLGNAVFFVLLGQLLCAAAIDHFGWWGAVQSSITLKRIAGLIIMVIGVYLARKDVPNIL